MKKIAILTGATGGLGSEFVKQIVKEEIDEVCWFDYEECKQAVKENTIPHCINLEELELLEGRIYDI